MALGGFVAHRLESWNFANTLQSCHSIGRERRAAVHRCPPVPTSSFKAHSLLVTRLLRLSARLKRSALGRAASCARKVRRCGSHSENGSRPSGSPPLYRILNVACGPLRWPTSKRSEASLLWTGWRRRDVARSLVCASTDPRALHSSGADDLSLRARSQNNNA